MPTSYAFYATLPCNLNMAEAFTILSFSDIVNWGHMAPFILHRTIYAAPHNAT
jgi:hypothetical protein